MTLTGCLVFYWAYREWLSAFLLTLILALPLFSLVISLPAMITNRLALRYPQHTTVGAVAAVSWSPVCRLPEPRIRGKLVCREGFSGKKHRLASGDKLLSKDKCCQYLTRVGLCANDYLDREVDVSLSGGEVKRIEIASILARNSDLMIFDEPEAGIDLWSFARLTETFEQIHCTGGATMIIISHQERIISLADEVIVVGDGQLRHRGAAADILPQILADTLGGCPVLTKEEKSL